MKPRGISVLKHALGRSAKSCAKLAAGLVFPPCCAYCDRELAGPHDKPRLCPECLRLLEPPALALCQRCGSWAAGGDCPRGCERCRGVRYRFDGVIPLGAYDEHLRAAVLRVKHPAEEPLARALAELYLARRRELLAACRAEVVVPVPMHWSRRIIRGANSPDYVAEVLARQLAIPVLARAVLRKRNTRPQGGLPRAKRLENVRGAFRLRAGYDFRGARTLVVDDILTTGATANEVARVLKQSGAASVVVAVLARAHGPD